ncbi:MAG: protease modulator HflC [Pseudomonadota bacterium]
MNQTRIVALAVIAGIAILILQQTFFTVPEDKTALVLRFGEPRQEYVEAGLKFKAPVIENVVMFDKRNRELDQPEIEILAANQERLVVDSFARYRIVDPLAFYRTVRDINAGEARMESLLEQALRQVLGSVTVQDIVTDRRAELMRRIRDGLRQTTEDIGVEIVDVKIRRADLPTQNQEAVFQRMRTERQQRAQQIRAEGNQKYQEITAQADREAVEIVAGAREQSEKIRGEADAERNKIFAEAYNRDPEFFAFYRSLLAYDQALKTSDAGGQTTILLSPDNEFFRYFNDLQGEGQ